MTSISAAAIAVRDRARLRRMGLSASQQQSASAADAGASATTKSELELVELPIYRALLAGAHEVRRQVVCPSGRVDIFDDTTSTIIECKARGDVASIAAARTQLERYRRHFHSPQLAIAVPHIEPEARWLVELLEKEDVTVFEAERGIGV